MHISRALYDTETILYLMATITQISINPWNILYTYSFYMMDSLLGSINASKFEKKMSRNIIQSNTAFVY